MIPKLMLYGRSLLFILILFLYSCNQKSDNIRRVIDLSGYWQFATDTADKGITEQWYETDLNDSIGLPGTTDLRHKGFMNHDTTTMHLNRLYKYEGPAWYRKKVEIPGHFVDKHIVLILERTKSSTVWVDGQLAGSSRLMQSAQQFDLSGLLTPGEHTITVRIDNSLSLTPFGNVHIYSDDTQTNWNGIIGDIVLEISPKTFISDLQVFPDTEKRKFVVNLVTENSGNAEEIDIEMHVSRIKDNRIKNLKTRKFRVPADSLIQLEYTLNDMMMLWDEYKRPLYEITVIITNGDESDSKTVSFGMRKFTATGTQFAVNGRTVFLRGKHDACVFPLTGFPPMDVKSWIKVFQKAKSYGVNHYRFHSWCPPEAAFAAADLEGVYLQAELPFWGGLDSDSIAEMLREEGFAMLRHYANHPSFVMFSHGNEIWSGHDRVEKNILAFKSFDNRPLYTNGSNNNIGYAAPRESSDFFVAARTPYSHDTILTHTRLTQAFADSRDGGSLNTQPPSTMISFDYAVSQINIPIVGHETGQYQIYPDYSEIEKYKGVLKPWNLEVFRKRLDMAGMLEQNKEFHMASGAWSALCYKAEMEAALRTKGFGGFQLLDLQDFPGQGTALVGILDAFMDAKGVIDRGEWLQSCNDVVILLNYPKFCWTSKETFKAKVQVANYSDKILEEALIWKISDVSGETVFTGELPNNRIPNNGLNDAGEISFPLESVKSPDKLRISISLKNSGYSNRYPVWVYPAQLTVEESDDILVAARLSNDVQAKLLNGDKVLLFPGYEDVKNNSVGGLFIPEFWNYGMFKGISEWVKKPVSPGTLGILTDPEHPVFSSFPTDFHTNWQWFSIIKASNPLILDKTDNEFRPIVQIIDNLERNYKLGLIFEFAVGKGKLLVCMSRLDQMPDIPEAVALYNSIVKYMKSESFTPSYSVDEKLLKELFK